jgi:hypothetical protein
MSTITTKDGTEICYEDGGEDSNLAGTLAKAKAAGAEVLWGPYCSVAIDVATLEFPGGYVAEVHQAE